MAALMFSSLDPAVQAALITAIATSLSSIVASTVWGFVMYFASRKNRQILEETREEFDGKFKQLIGEKQVTAAMTGLQAGLDMASAKAKNRREKDKG